MARDKMLGSNVCCETLLGEIANAETLTPYIALSLRSPGSGPLSSRETLRLMHLPSCFKPPVTCSWQVHEADSMIHGGQDENLIASRR